MIKKVLQGLLVMGAAAAVSLGATAYNADAAGITAKNYKVDYANQKLVVSALETGNTKLYVAKTTFTTKSVKVTNEDGTKTTVKYQVPKYAAEVEYDATKGMEIDISSYVTTKDVYLSIRGNKTTDWTLVKLPSIPAKVKAVVDATDTTVQIQDITDKKNPVEISGTEFCTTYGTWKEYTAAGSKPTYAKTTTVKLANYNQAGATLRFRVKATATAAAFSAQEPTGYTDENGEAIQAYVAAGNFASKELKAKIAKIANGPKATIDYAKQTIKLPANTTEYRVQTVNGTLNPFSAIEGDNGGKTYTIKLSELKTTAAKPAAVSTAVELDLRTKATDKKAASKATEYTLDAVGKLTAQTYTTKAAAISTTAAPSKYDVGSSVLDGGELSVTKVALNSKTAAATITVKNDTADTYEFIVSDFQTASKISGLTLPAFDDKATGKVAAGKSGTIKGKSGQYVYVHKAGNAKTGTWATPYVFFGVINNEK